jgi:hypothetical protein
MSRDRQIAVLASIVGLAGLIIGIVALSQDSAADDEWIRNRALAVGSDGSSDTPTLQTQLAAQGVADLTNRVEEMERREAGAAEASTEAEEQSQATQVAVQGVENDVVDLAERIAELETTSVPDGPEEVVPTEEMPTEEVEYGEEVDQVAVPEDGSGATEELTDELLTPPSTTEPETLQPITDVLDPSAGTDEKGDLASSEDEGNESDPGSALPSYVKIGKPAYIYEETVDLTVKKLSIYQIPDPCSWLEITFGNECGEYVNSGPQIQNNHYVIDKYLKVKVSCPNRVDFWEDEVTQKFPGPSVTLFESPEAENKNVTYWVSHSSQVSQKGVRSHPVDSPHLKGDPWPLKDLAYEIVKSNWPKSITKETEINTVLTRGVTVIIYDLDSGENHYVSLTVGLSHYPLYKFNDTSEWQCSADLTFVRSYP